MSTKIFNPDTGKWEVHGVGNASQLPILDIAGNFQGDENGTKTVERALAELAETAGSASEEDIKLLEGRVSENEKNIAWLLEHGGSGSGAVTPTITSEYEETFTIQENQFLKIPIFFTSPNMGEGVAYILIDGVESGYQTVQQGNNEIEIGVLTNITTNIKIYVRDRANLISNQLSFKVICGGIKMTVDFDTTADYEVGETIYIPYFITSESTEPIILHIAIDYDKYTQISTSGYNEFRLSELGVGIHKIEMYATSGEYKTLVIKFNLVIVNSTSLYVSTTFESGQIIEYGTPINIPYRISKIGSEFFDVELNMDNGLHIKTLSQQPGSYYWTVSDLLVGEHEFTIRVSSITSGEQAEVKGKFTLTYGDYTPLEIQRGGLRCWVNAKGKTNDDTDREEFEDMSGNGVKCKLYNSNYATNGWVDGTLYLDGNSYLEIDYKPWESNAKTGSTIEIYFKCNNIGIEDSVVLDYVDNIDPYKGCKITLDKATLTSMSSNREVFLDEDVWTTVSFVIDRTEKFGKLYINGVCNGAMKLSDTGSGTNTTYEDFSHSQKIYLGTNKGKSGFGAIEVKQFRVYNRALTHDEITTNWIAQIEDLEEQRKIYNFNFNNTTTPEMRLYGDTTAMSNTVSVPMRVKYTSPNSEIYGASFDYPACDVWWQGTSSLQYVLKNYSIRLKDENMAEVLYSPFKGGREDSIFCLKADYMESSHAHNCGIAKFINNCVYDTKNPSQIIDNRVRNTIEGFPVLMYLNDELLGCYNFNYDRYSTKAFGYDLIDGTISYEISANTDTTAGAFFKWTSASGKTEKDYYATDFEAVYPETRRFGDDDYEEIKRLVTWVNDADDILFREQINEYFNLEYLIRYYLIVTVFGAVDNLGKNAKITSYDGRIWYFQAYDLDTTLGLDNTGFLKFPSDIEVEAGTFNTSGSQLWTKLERVFPEEIKAEYSLMRQKEFTLDNIMSYIYGEQISQIPQTIYNKDMQTKYLNFGASYLYALHGDSYQHIKKWLRERLTYVDTLFDYTGDVNDFITIRANKLGEVYLDLQTYIPMYLRVKWRDEVNNNGLQKIRVGRGETVRFSYDLPTETDQEVIIYGGRYLKSLGDVSNLNPSTMLIANATKLTGLEVHSPNLINTDLSKCVLMRNIDVSGCTQLGTGVGASPSLTLSDLKYLEKLDARDTQLTAIYLNQKGGNLTEIHYPSSIQSIELRNLKRLTNINIPVGSALATLSLFNCENLITLRNDINLDNMEILKNLQHLNLQNSMIHLTQFDIVPLKLKSLLIGTMRNLTNIRIGGNSDKSYGTIPTLERIEIENCPILHTFEFTAYNNNDKNSPWSATANTPKLTVVDGFKLNLSNIPSLRVFRDRMPTIGLTQLFVPENLEELVVFDAFNNSAPLDFQFFSTLKDIWCPSLARNKESDFTGFNGEGLHVDNINFMYMTNIENIINANIKYNAQEGGRFNVLRTKENAVSPKGTFDYSEFKGSLNHEWRYINDSNGEMIIIFPDWSKINRLSNLFAGSTFSGISWDIANDILNNLVSISDKNSTGIFNETKLSPFERYQGLDVENTTVSGFTDGSSLFLSSNIPKLIKFKIPTAVELYKTFSRLNLLTTTSWDFANDVFKEHPLVTNYWEVFAFSQLAPFEKYNGLEFITPSCTDCTSAFNQSNLPRVESINCPKLEQINFCFSRCNNFTDDNGVVKGTLDNTWELVEMILNGCPKLKRMDSVVYPLQLQPHPNDGVVLDHPLVENCNNLFSHSNCRSVKSMDLPSLKFATSMFEYMDDKNELDMSYDVIIDGLTNSPLIEEMGNFVADTIMKPQTKPLSFNLPNLIKIHGAFTRTNINNIGEMHCPKVQKLENVFREMNLPLNSDAFNYIADMIAEAGEEVLVFTDICYNTYLETSNSEVYAINWDLKKCTNARTAFIGINNSVTNIGWRYKIDQIIAPCMKDEYQMFFGQIPSGDIKNIVYASPVSTNAFSLEGISGNTCALVENIQITAPKGMSYCFMDFKELLEIKNSLLNPTNANWMFAHCSKLTKISILDVSNITSGVNMLINCLALEQIDIVGELKVGIDISGAQKLNVATLMAFINALQDRNGLNSMTLTIGATNLAKLSTEQMQIAINKNWTLA